MESIFVCGVELIIVCRIHTDIRWIIIMGEKDLYDLNFFFCVFFVFFYLGWNNHIIFINIFVIADKKKIDTKHVLIVFCLLVLTKN